MEAVLKRLRTRRNVIHRIINTVSRMIAEVSGPGGLLPPDSVKLQYHQQLIRAFSVDFSMY